MTTNVNLTFSAMAFREAYPKKKPHIEHWNFTFVVTNLGPLLVLISPVISTPCFPLPVLCLFLVTFS